MNRPICTLNSRWISILLGALIVAWCLGVGAAAADDNVAQPAKVVDPSAKPQTPVSEAPSTKDAVTDARATATSATPLQLSVEGAGQLWAQAQQAAAAAATAQTAFNTLAGQLQSLDVTTRKALIAPVAAKAVRLGLARAALSELDGQVVLAVQQVAVLQSHDALRKGAAAATASLTVGASDNAEAEAEAVRAVELAKQREALERDETLKELLVRERRLAEELLAVTREHIDTMDHIDLEANQAATSFSKAKARLLSVVDVLPGEPTESVRRESADPALSELIELRRTARRHLDDSRSNLKRVAAEMEERRAEADIAKAAVESERERSAQLESAVGERRVAVAKAQFNVADQILDGVGQQRDSYATQIAEYRDRIDFLDTSIETLLPLVSDPRRSQFFALSRDDNWFDAIDGAREGAVRILDGGAQRWEQLIGLEWMSITAGAWMWGMFWRLILAVFLVRIPPSRVPQQVKRVTAAALRRRVFRSRPRRTVKTAEVLNAIAKPVFGYVAYRYVLMAHVVNTFPELDVLVWLVNGWFGYWFVVEVASALVLPRARRLELGKNSAAPLDLDESEASGLADFVGFELRGTKLMRSVRVVVTFSLLAHYIPDLVEKIVGVNVISWFVDFSAGVGLFGIIYWVISTWRDDIAVLFAGLAKDRLPKAVTIVNERKDHFYGVLIIAVASIYVIAVEVSIIVRRYVLDTEAFRKASNFAFRKKIEMQAQKQEAEEEQVDEGSIPLEYKGLFESEPLEVGSLLYVKREEPLAEILGEFERWKERKRQGSIALIGEAGIGKTTVLRQLLPELEGEDRAVLFRSATQKRHRRSDVLHFVAELFDVEDVEGLNKAQLIEHIRATEARVIVIDDCHHFFMRRIGGFEGLEVLLDIVNLTDETHFWVLSFNVFAWSYVNRVSGRAHYFGSVLSMPLWTEDQIQELVGHRNRQSSFEMSFTDMVTHDQDNRSDYFYEVVKTARGYFRYLHEFCDGNPRIAMVYWLRSIRPVGGTMQVSLFRRPTAESFDTVSDNHWFVLAALAQHGQLNAADIARVINTEEGFCHLALNFFEEMGVVSINPDTEQARLAPTYFRYVLRKLQNSNYLYR